MLLHAPNFFLSELLPSECSIGKMAVSKSTYRGTVFVHNGAFPTANMTKNHEDTDTMTYYFHVKFKILQQSGTQWMYM